MAELVVYGAGRCPYTAELVDELEWQGRAFSYVDVDEDAVALARLLELTGQRAVPVLVEDGEVKEVGYRGRSCAV